MSNTALINTYIKTRLELAGFPHSEFEWAVEELSGGIEFDLISMDDPLYPMAVAERSYVSFYGPININNLIRWLDNGLLNSDGKDSLLESWAKGANLILVCENGVPQVKTRMHETALDRDKMVFDIGANFLTEKYNTLRKRLAEEIKQIYESGLYTRKFDDDEQLRYAIDDIMIAFGKQMSSAT
ncbi:hypothetical protein [Alteromonas gracilis]|uniref:hypothetical protein n=1 Tax=Alteromonas gracilis TaxID=1479524 RepID=UPI003735EF6A